MNDLMHSSGRENQGFLERGKAAVFSVLYKLVKGMTLGEKYFYFSTVIMTLQMLYLPFSLEVDFAWPDFFHSSIGNALRYFSFGFLVLDGEPLFLIIGILALSIAVLSLAGLALLCVDGFRKENKHSAIVPVLGVLLRMGHTILLQPVLVALVKIMTCHPVSDSFYTCGSGVHFGLEVGAGVTIVAFLTVTSLYALTVVVPVPVESGKEHRRTDYCAPHGRVEFVATWIRGIPALAVGLAGNQQDAPRTLTSTLVTLIVASGVGLLFAYLYYLPFHKMAWNRACVLSYSIYLWAGVSLILAEAIRSRDDMSSLLVFIVALPFFLFTTSSLIRQRIQVITKTTNDIVLQSPYLVELRLRLLHHVDGKVDFSGEVEEAYRKAIDSYPESSFLCLYTAALTLQSAKKVVFALNLIRKARYLPLQFDNEFFLFCHNRANEERQSQSSGAISFMEFDLHLNQAREKIIETLKLTVKFWKKLSTDSTVSELIKDGRKIHEATSACRQHLKRLLKLSDSNVEAMRWYAIFTAYVMNDRASAHRILRRREQTHGAGEGNGGYAVCTVSGNAATLGQVLDCTDALCNLFGYSKTELVGRNVKMLCPPPFDIVHDLFLKHFLSTDAEFTTKTRRIYGLHRMGYLIPLDFVITPSTNSNSDLILIGKFEERPLPESQHLLLIDAKTGHLVATNQTAPDLLGLDVNEIYTMNVHVTDIIPDFFNEDKSLRLKTEEHIQVNDNVFKARARMFEYKNVEGSSVSFDVRTIVVILTFVERINREQQFIMPSAEHAGHGLESGDSDNDSSGSEGSSSGDSDDDEDETDVNKDSSNNKEKETQAKVVQIPKKPDVLQPKIPPLSVKMPLKYNTTSETKKRVKKQRGDDDASELSFSNKKKSSNRQGGGAFSPTSPSSPSLFSPGLRSPKSAFFDGASQASSHYDGRGPPESQVAHIQKRIMAGLNQKNIKLVHFGRFAKRFLIGFSLIAIANTVLTSRLYSHLREEITFSSNTFEEGSLIASVANLVYFFSASPLFVNGTMFYRETPQFHNRLKSALGDLEEMHLSQVGKIQASLHHGLDDLLFDPLLVVMSPPSAWAVVHNTSVTSPQFKPVSLHVSVLDLIKHGEKYLQQNTTLCSESCSYIRVNALTSTIDAFQNATDTCMTLATESVQFSRFVGISFVGVVFVLLFISFVGGFAPIILDQIKYRAHVGQAFKDIPDDICESLRKKTETRLQSLTSGRKIDILEDMESEPLEVISETDDMDNSPGDQAWESSQSSGRVRMPESTSVSGATPSGAKTSAMAEKKTRRASGWLILRWLLRRGGDGEETASSKVVPTVSGGKARKDLKNKKTRKLTADTGLSRALRVLLSAFNVGLAFWVVLGYFVFVALLDRKFQRQIMDEYFALHYAGTRFLLFYSLAFWSAQQPTPQVLHRVSSLVEELESVNHGLIYGDATRQIPAFKEAEGELYTLYFENACGTLCQEYLQTHPVVTQDVEFLQYGSQLSLEKYVERVRAIRNAMALYLENPTAETLNEVHEMQLAGLNLEPHMAILEAFQQLAKSYDEKITVTLAKVNDQKVVSVCILISLLIVGHVVSLKAFSSMDKNVKNTKTLLLMLPVEVFTSVPSMKKLLQENQE